ncbi:MAG: sigma 54-interacting transcriptional regulator [Candidatus Latescibacterota bacterium]|nr:MAG: sigma 54-interacting transcriptional regulator [Candidatus Latescibacterota bacterium]
MTDNDDRTNDQGVENTGSSNLFDEMDAHIRESKVSPDAKARRARVEDLQRRYSIIETLLQVSTSINSTLNLEELLGRIVDAVVQITGAKRGYLMLRDDDTGDLTPALARYEDGREMPHNGFDLSMSVTRRVAETREPVFISNVGEDEELKEQRSIVDLNILTVICIPLEFEGRLVGVIYADSDRISETFSPSDLSIMNAFGAQAAVAIVNAMRHGELEDITRSLEKQNISLREELAGKYEFSGMVGRSPAMQRIFGVIRKVAGLSTTVLIQGETGTGKELIAKAVHYDSDRRNKSIVSVNCGALPKDILESELFGYRKGAFTGADQDRAGLFEAADGGTLFLDEIGEMPVDLQVKLLRALQDGEVRRLGEDHSRSVDVRVISATNKDLAAEVERGSFRRDLYYRLNVVPIHLPPLRDRQEDILPLAEFFLEKYSEEMKKSKPTLTRAAKELLLQHDWNGNVRELQNAIERALALAEGRDALDVAQFEHLARQKSLEAMVDEDASLKSMLLVWEKELIRKMLIKNSWNVSKTASVLRVSRQQLHNKIKKYELNPIV